MITVSYKNKAYRLPSPSLCPHCNHLSQMDSIIPNNKVDLKPSGIISGAFECGYEECKKYVIADYVMNGDKFEISKITPASIIKTQFPEAVTNISPSFVEVFGEAETARQLGLPNIARPGYRKAFEFLIKDYAISLKPDNADKIRSTFAGSVVSENISDPRIQAVAKRCLWLGNDETHYVRKWEDKDINDLTVLIKATAHWIETDYITNSYVHAMPDHKNSNN